MILFNIKPSFFRLASKLSWVPFFSKAKPAEVGNLNLIMQRLKINVEKSK